MFKLFKKIPKEVPTYMMGLFSKGKELKYPGYKRQLVELEMIFQNGNVCVTNTNVINFYNIHHDSSPMVSVVFDKNGEQLMHFYIRHNVGIGDDITYLEKTIQLLLPDQTQNKHIFETMLR